MQKSRFDILFFLVVFLFFDSTNALDIWIQKPNGGGESYYRFWFIYALISSVMTVILLVGTLISMCRRYKLVAGQEQELSEIQW